MASYVASLPGDHSTEMLTEAVAEDRLADGEAWFGQLDAVHQGKALGYLLESMLPADVEGAEVLALQSQHPDGLVQFAKMCAHRDLEAAVKWG
ncbi:hypothetical protein OAV21_05065 [bacterium]|nr:hypothetical protein [Verrucomicrobiales bacterium]MDC0502753.1 hypothetical protein [Verrucomicrobiales bacterium]MDC3255739.1 hypothetical protein [bacterium]